MNLSENGIQALNNNIIALPVAGSPTVTVQVAIPDGQVLQVDQGASIIVGGVDAVIDAVNGTTVTVNNDGTITSTADDAIDAVGSTLFVTNTGTIAGVIFGVNATTLANLINSGAITGAVFGINATTITSLINSGTIAGLASDGIFATTITSLVNSGTIAGLGGDGIQATTITSLINSGTIIGSIAAIQELGASDTTLTLLAGSNIQGPINLGGGGNVLNVGNGLSIANSFVNTGGSIVPVIGTTNGAPFAVLGNRIAVVDPTQLSTQDESFADLTGSIFSTVQSRLSGLRNGVAGVTTNPRPMQVAGDGVSPAGHRQYWAQGFGAIRDQEGDGPALDTDHRLAGFVSGLDAVYSHATRAGFFVGAPGARWSMCS